MENYQEQNNVEPWAKSSATLISVKKKKKKLLHEDPPIHTR